MSLSRESSPLDEDEELPGERDNKIEDLQGELESADEFNHGGDIDVGGNNSEQSSDDFENVSNTEIEAIPGDQSSSIDVSPATQQSAFSSYPSAAQRSVTDVNDFNQSETQSHYTFLNDHQMTNVGQDITNVDNDPKELIHNIPELSCSKPVSCTSSKCAFVREGFISSLPQPVQSLIYWRCPIKTGIILFIVLTLLVSMTCVSFISVAAYASLSCLLSAFAFRIYNEVMLWMGKTGSDGEAGEGRYVQQPFKCVFEKDFSIRNDSVERVVKIVVNHMNATLTVLKDLFLIKSYKRSITFAIVVYLVSYVGAVFNLLTLIILGVVGLFTFPKVYEVYQIPIDNVFHQICEVCTTVIQKAGTLPIIGAWMPKCCKQKSQ